MELLHQKGLDEISPGVESGDDWTLKQKNQIINALQYGIDHLDMKKLAGVRRAKQSL